MGAHTTGETRSIRLVCFDLGGVLLRVRDGWADACQAAGVPLPAALADPTLSATMTGLSKQAELGAIDARQFAEQTARITGLTVSQVYDISAAWLCGPCPGARELLDRVWATGLQTACLSNTSNYHWQLLTTPGALNDLALDRLTYRFASHLIGYAKPAPAVYRYVESLTGILPAGILFFDDSHDSCQAASDRGWHAYQIDPAGDPVAQMYRYLAHHDVL